MKIKIKKNKYFNKDRISVTFEGFTIPEKMKPINCYKRKVKKFSLKGYNFYITTGNSLNRVQLFESGIVYLPKNEKINFTVTTKKRAKKYILFLKYILENLHKAKDYNWEDYRFDTKRKLIL